MVFRHLYRIIQNINIAQSNTFSPTDYSGTSFLATFDTDTLTPTDPIVFNYPVHNAGGHYDSATGIYTVPIDGTYEFIVHIWSSNDNSVDAYLIVDDTDVSHATALPLHK